MTADTIGRAAEGYADAMAWLPTATPEEVSEFLDREHDKGTVFIYTDHTLANYWGCHEPIDEPIGDVDPWDCGYGQGFYTALHEWANP